MGQTSQKKRLLLRLPVLRGAEERWPQHRGLLQIRVSLCSGTGLSGCRRLDLGCFVVGCSVGIVVVYPLVLAGHQFQGPVGTTVHSSSDRAGFTLHVAWAHLPGYLKPSDAMAVRTRVLLGLPRQALHVHGLAALELGRSESGWPLASGAPGLWGALLSADDVQQGS